MQRRVRGFRNTNVFLEKSRPHFASIGRMEKVSVVALAVDLGDVNSPNGNVWVGCYDERKFYKLSGVDGSLIRGQTNPISISPSSTC